MRSVLADAPFERTTLTYEIETGVWGTDEYGNPVPEVEEGTVSALLAPFRANQLNLLPGADVTTSRARGELVDPLDFPVGIRVGSVLSCSYAGRDWQLTLESVVPNDIPSVAFGAYFEARMEVT